MIQNGIEPKLKKQIEKKRNPKWKSDEIILEPHLYFRIRIEKRIQKKCKYQLANKWKINY